MLDVLRIQLTFVVVFFLIAIAQELPPDLIAFLKGVYPIRADVSVNKECNTSLVSQSAQFYERLKGNDTLLVENKECHKAKVYCVVEKICSGLDVGKVALLSSGYLKVDWQCEKSQPESRCAWFDSISFLADYASRVRNGTDYKKFDIRFGNESFTYGTDYQVYPIEQLQKCDQGIFLGQLKE